MPPNSESKWKEPALITAHIKLAKVRKYHQSNKTQRKKEKEEKKRRNKKKVKSIFTSECSNISGPWSHVPERGKIRSIQRSAVINKGVRDSSVDIRAQTTKGEQGTAVLNDKTRNRGVECSK